MVNRPTAHLPAAGDTCRPGCASFPRAAFPTGLRRRAEPNAPAASPHSRRAGNRRTTRPRRTSAAQHKADLCTRLHHRMKPAFVHPGAAVRRRAYQRAAPPPTPGSRWAARPPAGCHGNGGAAGPAGWWPPCPALPCLALPLRAARPRGARLRCRLPAAIRAGRSGSGGGRLRSPRSAGQSEEMAAVPAPARCFLSRPQRLRAKGFSPPGRGHAAAFLLPYPCYVNVRKALLPLSRAECR